MKYTMTEDGSRELIINDIGTLRALRKITTEEAKETFTRAGVLPWDYEKLLRIRNLLSDDKRLDEKK